MKYALTPFPGPHLRVHVGDAPNQVYLTWHNVNKEGSYRIERSTDGTNWQAVGTTRFDKTTYADTIPDVTVSYKYRVIAVGKKEDSVPSDVVSTYASFTVDELAGIIYNETSAVRASQTSNTSAALTETRNWIAHVAINRSLRGHREGVAKTTPPDPLKDLTTQAARDAWKDTQATAKQALDESNSGSDPTDKSLFYRLRQGTNWKSGLFPSQACRQYVPMAKGPFWMPVTIGVLKKGPNLFIDFWNNPQLKLGGAY